MGNTGGKHVKKRKAAPGSRMVLVIGGLALMYFVAKLIGALFGGVETVSASHVNVDDAITATGCFIRNEVVVAGAQGETVEHVVHSGEKVYTGARLAVEYADASALEVSRELRQLSGEISLLQSTIQSSGDLSDTARLDQLITIQMRALAAQTHDGMIRDLDEDASALRQLVMRRVAGSQDAQELTTQLASLQQRQQSLQSSVSARTNVISAPCAGYFSETVDGYESVFQAPEIDKLTLASFEDKLSAPVTPDAGALGKVMQGFEWYFACIVPKEDAASLSAGRSYRLRFSQVSQDVKATLYAARPSDDGSRTLLIFRSNIISSELVSMRQQVVDIVRSSYNGIKVPKNAVRTDEKGNLGVFTLSGSVSRFKQIEPIYEGDKYYVIKQASTEDAGVVVQDEIIVKGRELRDQKVVK